MFRWWALILVFLVSCKAPKFVDRDGWGGSEKVTQVASKNEVEISQEINLFQYGDSSLCIDHKQKKVSQSAFKLKIKNTIVKQVDIESGHKQSKTNSHQNKPDLSRYFVSYNMLMDLGALFLIVGFTVLGVLGGIVGTSATVNSDSTIAIIFIPCLIFIGIGFVFWFAGLYYFNHFQKNKKKK